MGHDDMRRGASDQLASITSPDGHEKLKAVEYLSRGLSQGTVPPILDWDGDALDGWLDLLGLNNRRMADRQRLKGVRS